MTATLLAWLLCAGLGQPCVSPGDVGLPRTPSAPACCHGYYCPASGRNAGHCVTVHPATGVCP